MNKISFTIKNYSLNILSIRLVSHQTFILAILLNCLFRKTKLLFLKSVLIILLTDIELILIICIFIIRHLILHKHWWILLLSFIVLKHFHYNICISSWFFYILLVLHLIFIIKYYWVKLKLIWVSYRVIRIGYRSVPSAMEISRYKIALQSLIIINVPLILLVIYMFLMKTIYRDICLHIDFLAESLSLLRFFETELRPRYSIFVF